MMIKKLAGFGAAAICPAFGGGTGYPDCANSAIRVKGRKQLIITKVLPGQSQMARRKQP